MDFDESSVLSDCIKAILVQVIKITLSAVRPAPPRQNYASIRVFTLVGWVGYTVTSLVFGISNRVTPK